MKITAYRRLCRANMTPYLETVIYQSWTVRRDIITLTTTVTPSSEKMGNATPYANKKMGNF